MFVFVKLRTSPVFVFAFVFVFVFVLGWRTKKFIIDPICLSKETGKYAFSVV